MDLRTLVERRATLADMHDNVRSRWSLDRPEFANELREVAAGLAAVAADMLGCRDATPAELARSQMWLGDAYFDLAQGRHAPFAAAIDAYRAAEPYVRIAHDELMSAKFDANFANILMRANPLPVVLTEVIERYRRSLPVLSLHESSYAERIRGELARAETLQAQQDELASQLRSRRQEFAAFVSSGSLASLGRAEAEAVTTMLRELVDAYDDAERSGNFSSVLMLMERARSVFQRLMAALSPPVAGPRGRLAATIMKLWSELAAIGMTAQVDSVTRDRAFDVMPRLIESREGILSAAGTEAPGIVAGRLLPAAADARRLLGRSLLTWTTPMWPVGRSPAVANGLYVTPSAMRARLIDHGRQCGLEPIEIPSGREAAEATFDAIRRSAVLVADVADTPQMRAAVCYEIGIALTLGKPLVVLAPHASRVPFDIDITPLAYPETEEDFELLADALERALLLPQRTPDGGSLAPLVHAARRVFAALPAGVDEVERSADTPLEAEAALANLLRQDAADTGRQHLLAHTAWMRLYPQFGERRLFHVMPFGAAWSKELKEQTQSVCASHDVRYRRGDDVEDPRVIRSIWDELCLASHVLVDLTDLNPNVTLELGIVHALGKHVLAVAQPGTVARLFPMLKNVRVTEYDLGHDQYAQSLATFLSRST